MTELYHHGIKGQKWGVRRYQNADGSLTSEGKKRYGESSKKVQKLIEKERVDKNALDDLLKDGISSEQFTKRYLFGDKYSDKQFESAYKISKREAINKTVDVLNKRIIRDEYRRKLISGEELNEQEAKLRREDNIKKALIIAGVTGVGIYAAYKLTHKPISSGIMEQDISAGEVERVIKQGFDFHRMSGWKTEDFGDQLYAYASATATDRDIYRTWLKDFHHTGERWESTLRAAKDIRVAGSKKQMELLNELLEQDDYFDDFSLRFRGFKTDPEDRNKFRESMSSGSDFAKQYYKKVFADISAKDSSLAKRYVEFAMSKGYDAFIDDNDRGSMSYSPIILFNPKDSVKQVGSRRIREINKTVSSFRLRRKGVAVSGGGIMLPNKRK